MCCFSGPVKDVAATRIFARMATPGRQIIAYEMVFTATEPVAMILPVPTPPGSGDDAVRFISLAKYPSLFDDLEEAFTYPHGRPRALSNKSAAPQPAKLVVHTVGDFVASFVPSLADFDRLDPRFRIPPGTVDRVPTYADYGFVVFQLGATKTRARVHPMAFEFPTRDAKRLFFPLLHVHDGELHAEAEFDHALYAQGLNMDRMFELRSVDLRMVVHNPRATLVLNNEDQTLSRREMIGTGPNRDVWAQLA